MDLMRELLESERRLTEGDADAYRERLLDDAVVIVPGQVLAKTRTVDAIATVGGWDCVALEEERLVRLTDDVAVISYRFTGQRSGAPEYTAFMSSAYVRRDGRWLLGVHQQTPV